MPVAMTGQYFKAATDILQNDAHDIETKIEAALAADEWIRLARSNEYKFLERKVPLIPHVLTYFKGLLRVGWESMSESHARIILEKFENALWVSNFLRYGSVNHKQSAHCCLIVSQIDRDAAASILGELCSFNCAIFMKFRDNTKISDIGCDEMFCDLGDIAERSQVMQDACKESILASGLLSVVEFVK